jgi:hypothetical protein
MAFGSKPVNFFPELFFDLVRSNNLFSNGRAFCPIRRWFGMGAKT